MRTLEGSNRVRRGIMAVIIAALVVGVGQSFSSVPMLFATPTYYAQFTDTGGVNKGDKVQIAGVDVGVVRSIAIQGNKVVIGYSLGDKTIGTESRAAIRTDTLLGRKNIEIEPRGAQQLRANGILPVGQTTTPYQIYDAFFDVTKAATGWDIDTVKRSLNVLSQTVDATYPHLSAALDGVKSFSDTIGKRDEQIKQVLANAKKVAGVLGDRSEQIDRLLVNAKTLLAAFNQRGRQLEALLTNVSRLSAQVSGLINDNPNLNGLLKQLRTVTDLLVKDKRYLVDTLTLLSRYLASLGEAVGSGPFFKATVANLLPYQILQPWVDAAFKKRGIDPEEFWRNAGLPAFRFPDPNGARFPNGAPPPAPPVLEGTPDHPGPAVPPGSPCSYTPAPETLPRPGDPLPCAHLDQGPYGPVLGGYPAPVDVQMSPPNPNGLPPTPGIPIAGRPGQQAPDVPGTPVPLPSQAPPGARTEPLGPAGPTPPPSTLAPVLPPGPPAPPGPGPQLPAPFITPDGTGGSSQ
jgi:phospholipid/cholesterol/gamma-HCH transport system substrate-binding protein